MKREGSPRKPASGRAATVVVADGPLQVRAVR
ncbi:hypothetical protein BH24ACI5_BH24ACI5_25390 [soil metagenome]